MVEWEPSFKWWHITCKRWSNKAFLIQQTSYFQLPKPVKEMVKINPIRAMPLMKQFND